MNQTAQQPAPVQVLANPPLPEIVITGPINQVMFREGRQYAIEVAQSAGSDLRKPGIVAKIIRNLTMTAVEQPASRAAGIKTVIDLLSSS